MTLELALSALRDAENIMASHTCRDRVQSLAAAKKAAPLMHIYTDAVVSGVFDPATSAGTVGAKILGALKSTLDHIFKPDQASVPGLDLKPAIRMSSMLDRFSC